MKRMMAILLTLLCVWSIWGCQETEKETVAHAFAEKTTEQMEQPLESPISEARKADPTQEPTALKETATPFVEISEENEEFIGEFMKQGGIKETALLDSDSICITAKSLEYDSYSVKLKLLIENKSSIDLTVITGSIGYSPNSINGYMVDTGYLNCDVAAGKKSVETISFDYDELMVMGIYKLADLEIGFEIKDKNYNSVYSAPVRIETAHAASYDYSVDTYQETIASKAAQISWGYTVPFFSTDVPYEKNGIRLLSRGILVNQDGETMAALEFENISDTMIQIKIRNITVNGLVVNSSLWSSDDIYPGKKRVVNVNLENVIKKEYREAYGIHSISAIEVSVELEEENGAFVTDAEQIVLEIPGNEVGVDTSGKELYNSNGIRIVAKAIMKDPSSYSKNLHIPLLVENNYGETIIVDDVYNSLSVNGFMVNGWLYSMEIPRGGMAAMDLELAASSLEEMQLNDPENIENIEFKLRIETARKKIGDAEIKITYK